MKKVLIIDGYNFIHYPFQRHPEQRSDEGSPVSGKKIDSMELERETLVEKLISYAGIASCKVLLVFDGNSEQSIKKGQVEIIFTKKASTADSFIEKTLTEMDILDDVILVTNDRASRDFATGLGVKVLPDQWLFDEIYSKTDKTKDRATNMKSRHVIEERIDTATKKKLDKIIGRPHPS